MQRTAANTFLGFRKPAVGAAPKKTDLLISDRFIMDKIVLSMPARVIAIALFLYFFIEQGTLGLFPEKYYKIYRSVRISDIILYLTVIYSLYKSREYMDLFKSRSFLIAKVLLAYLAIEFFFSFIKYKFEPVEYFFRLKGLWSSFLVFPFMLLYKRNGIGFLVKIVFPVAIISNILYTLTALTGIAFLPDVSLTTQVLPGGIAVYRVYGGTFFGEMFFLGFVYMWIMKKFRIWQLFLAMLFITPHILAFGRSAWAYFAFAIVAFAVINSLKRKNFKLLFKQAFMLILAGVLYLLAFVAFIPDTAYYFDALSARFTQGENDVKYSEGSYGTRVIFQNNALIRLWLKSDLLIGVGMHPMWVVKPEDFDEEVYYNAFCDVQWPSVLAAYGLIGFAIGLVFQVYYIVLTWRMIRKPREPGVHTFLVTVIFTKFVFDTFINFTYAFLSIGLWGIASPLNFYVATIVYNYENNRKEELAAKNAELEAKTGESR